MKEIHFRDIRPFVRYARRLDAEMKKFAFPLCAYDCRLFYCVGGRGEITADKVSYPVEEGTLIYLPVGVPYGYAPDKADPMRLLAFNFDLVWDSADISVPFPPDRAENFDPSETVSEVRVLDLPVLSEISVLKNRRYLYSRLSEIYDEFTASKVFFEQRCSGLMLSVLGEIALCSEGERSEKGLDTVEAVINYLGENYAEDITNKRLGEIFGYHPNYLNRIFIQHTGKSLYKYLLDLRIMHAIHILQDTDARVSEVANAVGFKDVPHFSRYFKQKTGYSPTDFR